MAGKGGPGEHAGAHSGGRVPEEAQACEATARQACDATAAQACDAAAEARRATAAQWCEAAGPVPGTASDEPGRPGIHPSPAAASARHVVLAVGAAGDSAQAWFPAGADVEVVACENADQARVWLCGSRSWSAVLLGSGHRDDPDLVAAARRRGVAVLVPPPPGTVPDGEGCVPWMAALRSSATPITPGGDVGRCGAALAAVTPPARPVAPAAQGPSPGPAAPTFGRGGPGRGGLVAVCGPGGTGASTVAAALAGGLASLAGPLGDERVVLADLALRAGQTVLHGLAQGTAGLESLVHAHSRGGLTPRETRAFTSAPSGRPYRLLAGLLCPSHWTAVRPLAFDAALEALRDAFLLVVADVTGDLEGEADTGSADIEDRNHMARRTVADAEAVVVVGQEGPTGRHALRLVQRAMQSHVGDGWRIVPVVNRSSGDPPAGWEQAAIRLGPLGTIPDADLSAWGRPVTHAVTAILARRPRPAPGSLTGLAPVEPGSIGHWQGSAG